LYYVSLYFNISFYRGFGVLGILELLWDAQLVEQVAVPTGSWGWVVV
jgi:hypothetical protein